MVNLKVVWTTEDQAIPGAASFTKYRIKVGDFASAVIPITEREFTFQDVTAAPGKYPATVELISDDELQVGGVATGEADIPAMVAVPMTVTVSVA